MGSQGLHASFVLPQPHGWESGEGDFSAGKQRNTKEGFAAAKREKRTHFSGKGEELLTQRHMAPRPGTTGVVCKAAAMLARSMRNVACGGE